MRIGHPVRWAVAAVAAVAVVAVVLVLVVGGRYEGRHEEQRQRDAMTSLYAVVGSRLDASNLSGYRFDGLFNCFTYQVGTYVFALQYCFDDRGALVEAVDRRGIAAVYWSLAYKPSAAPILADPRQLRSAVAEILLIKECVPRCPS